MLTSTLRSLERDGLVRRDVQLAVPVKVEYSLTARGRTVVLPLGALREWAIDHFSGVIDSRAV